MLGHILSFLYHRSFSGKNLHNKNTFMTVNPSEVEFIMLELCWKQLFQFGKYFNSVKFPSTNV